MYKRDHVQDAIEALREMRATNALKQARQMGGYEPMTQEQIDMRSYELIKDAEHRMTWGFRGYSND